MPIRRACLLIVTAVAMLRGASVTYALADLGGGFWRYDYSIASPTFVPGQGITFHFAPDLYSSLSNPIAPAGWDPLVYPAGIPAGATGEFDLLAAIPNPGLTGISIEFEYLGTGQPGSQPFDTYTLDPVFTVLEQGNTTSGVPEPSVLLLAIGGLGAIACRRYRRT